MLPVKAVHRLPGIKGPIPSAALDKDFITDYTIIVTKVNSFIPTVSEVKQIEG